MSLKKLSKNYAAYNAWANEKWVTYLKTKPQQMLSQEVSSSFSSAIKTLHHVLVSQEFWLSVIIEVKNERDRDENDPFEVDEVLNSLVENSVRILDWVNHSSESDLQKLVRSPWLKDAIPKYDVTQHCINHSTYHRGQLTSICRQLKFKDLPNTDYHEYLHVAS